MYIVCTCLAFQSHSYAACWLSDSNINYVHFYLQHTDPPIMLLSPPTNSTVSMGMDHMIQCKFEGVPTPTVVWSRDGSVLTDGSNDIAIATGDTSSTLTITTVMANETGNYTCMVSNLLGSATTSSLLQIPGVLQVAVNKFTCTCNALAYVCSTL